MATDSGGSTTGFVAFRHPDFVHVFAARVLNGLATNMLHIAIGWEVWRITGEPLMLGYVGMAMFVPNPLFFLAAGVAADRFPRRHVLSLSYALQLACALALLAIFAGEDPSMPLVLAILFLVGVGRIFSQPANHGLLPNVVPKEHFPNAIAWGNLGQQFATISGPAIGGALLAFGSTFVFATIAVFYAATSILMYRIRSRSQVLDREPVRLATVLAGLRFIFRRQIILGAISLDLFAVLLGGVRALLPVYATDILHVGAAGLGLLASSIAVGAALCGLVLTRIPIRRRTGRTLFVTVGVFGIAIVAFGLSEAMWLSMAALALSGAADMVSLFIRQTLIQFATPDDMRGRVTAVNSVFVGASNELGEFESGLLAALIGVVPTVVVGGLGTIAVAAAWAAMFPLLRRVDALDHDEIRRLSDLAEGTRRPAAEGAAAD